MVASAAALHITAVTVVAIIIMQAGLALRSRRARPHRLGIAAQNLNAEA